MCLPLPPAKTKQKKTLACIREIQADKLWTKVDSYVDYSVTCQLVLFSSENIEAHIWLKHVIFLWEHRSTHKTETEK